MNEINLQTIKDRANAAFLVEMGLLFIASILGYKIAKWKGVGLVVLLSEAAGFRHIQILERNKHHMLSWLASQQDGGDAFSEYLDELEF